MKLRCFDYVGGSVSAGDFGGPEDGVLLGDVFPVDGAGVFHSVEDEAGEHGLQVFFTHSYFPTADS